MQKNAPLAYASMRRKIRRTKMRNQCRQMQQARARATKTAPPKSRKKSWARAGAAYAARTLSPMGSRPPRHEFQTAPEGLPEVVPHPGSRNRIFVDQNEKRDLISRALGAQIPNPGSVSRRAKREIFDFLPPPHPPRGANSRRHRKDFRKWSPTLAREIAFLWTKIRSET